MALDQSPNSMSDFAARAGKVAALLRELANENRLLILCKLVEQRQATVNELVDAIGLSQSAVSQHLARLRADGILARRRDGTRMNYLIADKNIRKILKTLKTIYC